MAAGKPEHGKSPPASGGRADIALFMRAQRIAGAVPAAPLQVHAVTPERWDDLHALFAARGGPHFCWCATYRGGRTLNATQKREALHRTVAQRVPVGVLAYDAAGQPVGWCSIAPRDSYALARSRTMPALGAGAVWTIVCFFVPRAQRGRGVARALLSGALAAARDGGADEVEAWPSDAAGTSAAHRGTTPLFARAGLAADPHDASGRRWLLRLREPGAPASPAPL